MKSLTRQSAELASRIPQLIKKLEPNYAVATGGTLLAALMMLRVSNVSWEDIHKGVDASRELVDWTVETATKTAEEMNKEKK